MMTVLNPLSCEPIKMLKTATESLSRFPLRAQVENANKTRLDALPGEDVVYHAQDVPGLDIYKKPIAQARATKMLDNTIAPSELRLRIGAQVMLTKVRQRLSSAKIYLTIL